MTSEQRVLPAEALGSIDEYVKGGGGRGLDAARRLGPLGIIDDIEASGLRGRGGAGFTTGRKWRTVALNITPSTPPTVVVNAAEGEPGTFKDRAILRTDPYRVIEGALVAATAVGAQKVVLALKKTFDKERRRVDDALAEVRSTGWTDGIDVSLMGGPSEYLYGEETALLEVLAGRGPFPRIAPPFRHGVSEMGEDTASAAQSTMAGPAAATPAPPTLVNNVETMANVAAILAEGADWFRSVGTDESPGTVVCTITGRNRRHAVGEVAMGTPLDEVIESVGGGARGGRRIVAAMSGVANPLVTEDLLGTPVSYEGMQAIDSGLGAAGFIVFDNRTDMVAVAAGVSRFLAVESCGQCTPCKQDGLALCDLLAGLARNEGGEGDLEAVRDRLSTVADSARCFLAHQQERVLTSILEHFEAQFDAHAQGRAEPAEPELIAAIVDLRSEQAELDRHHLDKQPDWTFDDTYSGQSPADRVDQRAPDEAG